MNLWRIALDPATGRPLVLHGGSGIGREYVLGSFQHGISKVNVGTEIRQSYEQALRATNDVEAAQQACYDRTHDLLLNFFNLGGMREKLTG